MRERSDEPDFAGRPRCCGKCGEELGAASFCRACGTASIPVPPRKADKPIPALPSPAWAVLSLLLPGLPLLIFRQPFKGLAIMIPCFLFTWLIPFAVVSRILGLLDAYKVGSKLRRTGAVQPWEFFPS